MTTTATAEKIKQMEKTAQEGIEKTRQAVNDKLDTAKDKVSAAAKSLRKTDGVLHEKARQLSATAREKAELARDGLRDGYDRVTTATEKAVRENPARAAALAALVGFCLGWALTPKRRRAA